MKVKWRNQVIGMMILLSISTCFWSCSKTSNSDVGDGTTAQVEFMVSGSEFDGVKNITNSAASPYENNVEEESLPVKNTLEVGDGMLLIAELSPEDPQQIKQIQSRSTIKGDKKAAIETGNLVAGTRYRVVVFDNNGTYVRQQEYVSGSEATAPAMMLDGGRTYTFIAYSINTTATVPEPTFTGGQQTLASTVVSVAGNQDFMYFRRDLTLVGGPTPNRLSIVLKHRFSQVTTIINATQTGYIPTNITASFGPHSNTALINLNTGVITRNTQTDRSSATAQFVNNNATDSYVTIVNAAANIVTTYNIASLTIGPLTLTNLTPFPALTMTPGIKYNLTLNVVPTDEYIVHQGLPAVRINGRLWMRHNLGADYSTVAEESPMSNTRFGTYFQWGRVTVVAQPTATSTSNWNGSNAPGADAWNFGTELAPEKHPIGDPCPTGFRVPTMPEAQDLADNTIHTDMGAPFVAGSTRYTSAKVLTSKKNRNVSIVFPLQGTFGASGNGFPYQPGGLSNRGTFGGYHTSTLTGNRPGRFTFNAGGAQTTQPTNSNNAHRVGSYNIKCIAQ